VLSTSGFAAGGEVAVGPASIGCGAAGTMPAPIAPTANMPAPVAAAAASHLRGTAAQRQREPARQRVRRHGGGRRTGADAGARLVVCDSGPGFSGDGEQLRRGVSGAGSSGLGLDIVRRTAQASAGAMAIDKAPDGGARITVDLGAPRQPQRTL
jgi:signal transduction histidine kinase